MQILRDLPKLGVELVAIRNDEALDLFPAELLRRRQTMGTCDHDHLVELAVWAVLLWREFHVADGDRSSARRRLICRFERPVFSAVSAANAFLCCGSARRPSERLVGRDVPAVSASTWRFPKFHCAAAGARVFPLWSVPTA
jgi:hypothetical protein